MSVGLWLLFLNVPVASNGSLAYEFRNVGSKKHFWWEKGYCWETNVTTALTKPLCFAYDQSTLD